MIDPVVEVEILRLYKVEKWPVGTIARHCNVHHYVVERVLRQDGVKQEVHYLRPSMIDPYVAFILEQLEKYPLVCASRLYQMVYARGYRGGPDHFRARIAKLRPRRTSEAYLRLRTLPGDQCQVDWGHFGLIRVGRAWRKLMGFALTLSFSRYIFLRFYLDADMSAWMDAHVRAFIFFGGVPHVCLYDNLRSVVLERVPLPGAPDAIRINPKFLDLVAWYNFAPRPVRVRRGNEKGRVERGIRYIRDNFFAAREFTDIDDLNAQALEWCLTWSADRKCPGDDTQLVRACYEAEKSLLIRLPDEPFPVQMSEPVTAHKTPYVRFDLNDYSIPHTHVQRPLEVLANRDTVRILDGLEVIATHPRSFDRHAQIEEPKHIEELLAQKRAAHKHRAIDRLHHEAPSATRLFQLAADHGAHMGSLTRGLLVLLDTHGAPALEAAIQAALGEDSAHLRAVRHFIDLQQAQRGQRPLVAVALPDDPRVRNLTVRTHNLADYDKATNQKASSNDDPNDTTDQTDTTSDGDGSPDKPSS